MRGERKEIEEKKGVERKVLVSVALALVSQWPWISF